MKALDRRTFLRGAGGVALGLPLLNIMMETSAGAQAPVTAPRRILFCFKANGDQIANRFTATGETTFQFGEFLAPLEPYRADLLVLNKLDKRYGKLPELEKSDNHQQGGSALAPWPSGEGSYPIGGTDRKIGYVLGPSADYCDRHEGAREEPVRPASAPRLPRRPEEQRHLEPALARRPRRHAEPDSAGDRSVRGLRAHLHVQLRSGRQAAIRERLAKKQSALDLVLGETQALDARLGADGQAAGRAAHRRRYATSSGRCQGAVGGAACAPISLGTKLDPYNNDNSRDPGRAVLQDQRHGVRLRHSRASSSSTGQATPATASTRASG